MMVIVEYPHSKLPLITAFTVLCTLLNLFLNVDLHLTFFPRNLQSKHGRTSSESVIFRLDVLNQLFDFIDRDLPELWDLQGIQQVAMTPEESVHFRLDTEEGAAEWASALPRGKGVVFLPDTPTPFRVSLFHQLECLDAVRSAMHDRREHPSGPSTSQEAHFCLNYLRQSIQCHADAHLEMVRSEYGGRAVLPYTTRTDCKDWERVWAESEANFDGWWES